MPAIHHMYCVRSILRSEDALLCSALLLYNKTHIWRRHPVVATPVFVHNNIEKCLLSPTVGTFLSWQLKVKKCVVLVFLK